MFKLNLKIALRNLWKNKGFTLINVGGLAIGLASCMVLLLYVAYEWGYDKQFSNYKETYVVYNNQKAENKIFSMLATPGDLASTMKAEIPGVKNVTNTSYPENMMVSYNRNSFKKTAIFAEPDFFKIFDYKVLKGNSETFMRNPNSIILTETLARSLFGTEDPINKTVKFDNSVLLKVEGVIADLPKNTSIQFEYVAPWVLYKTLNPWTKDLGWGSNYCVTFVQLQDNSFFNKANNQLKGMIKAHAKESNNEAFMHPLSQYHLYNEFEGGKTIGGRIQQLQIFFLLAFCILLIACVNFMNLSTARSEKRAKEVGVRKAIGSSRKNLIGQFMLESVLLSVISMLVAFVLLEVILPYFNTLLGIILVIDYSDWRFWTVFAGLTVLTGIIAGSYPAFYLSSFDPIKVLKGFTIAGNSSLSVRRFLVVFQFVFATCVIICTAVIYQQLNFIKNKPIGYNKNNLIEMPVQGNLLKAGKYELLKDHLLKSGFVTNVTTLSMSILSGGNNGYDVQWDGKDPNARVLVNFRLTEHDFAKTMAMQLVAGRDFELGYNDSTNVLINESLVKVTGLKQPLGAKLKWNGTPVTVVGIIKNYVSESPYQEATPTIIGYNPLARTNILIRIATDNNLSLAVKAIDDEVLAINPDYPVDHRFVDEKFEQKFQSERLLGTLANWFGGFAILISCLGLLGLALYMAEQRKKEISIRKVLGADSLNILVLLNKDFIKLVALANVIAFPLGYIIINQWLSKYEFRIDISVWPFAIALTLSLIIAILTVSIQSFKVAKANPVDALKYE